MLREEMDRVLGGLDVRQTQLRAGGDRARWSIQQTVEHLLMTFAATINVVDARVAKGTRTRTRPTVTQRIGQVVVIRVGLFPPGRTAPEMVTPSADEPSVPSGVLIERVEMALRSLDATMIGAEKVFGADKRSIGHMILGPLSVKQWRRFHLVHARHHAKFIRQVRQEFGV